MLKMPDDFTERQQWGCMHITGRPGTLQLMDTACMPPMQGAQASHQIRDSKPLEDSLQTSQIACRLCGCHRQAYVGDSWPHSKDGRTKFRMHAGSTAAIILHEREAGGCAPAGVHFAGVQGHDAHGAGVLQHGQRVERLDLHDNAAPARRSRRLHLVQQNRGPDRLRVSLHRRPVRAGIGLSSFIDPETQRRTKVYDAHWRHLGATAPAICANLYM